VRKYFFYVFFQVIFLSLL